LALQTRLPAELSSFVGRQRELAEVRRLLGQTRLLTLAGVGGVGKSRLALRTARQCERVFPDGVYLVELAPLNDPGLVTAAVARGLGLRDEHPSDLAGALAEHVGSRRLLVVVDNCEHLLAASSTLVARLLRACPALVVVATSREPLGLEGEVVHRVPPLGLPNLDAAANGQPVASEAMTLFLERAQASLPTFELTPSNRLAIARLCRHLDGIPLAIEFAAVRLRALSVEQVLDRLERQLDLPSPREPGRAARQQTLRATMNWSHELLTEPERVLWRRLSVFAGGFSLEAAEQVCAGGGLDGGEVVGALVGLVDRSVVTRLDEGGTPRYRLLETVRQYGRERLREAGEDAATAAAHLDWCTRLAADAARRWWGPRQGDVLRGLEIEHENLRGALAHCLQDPADAVAGLVICADTWFFWHAQRHLGEGRRWLGELLALAPEPTPTRAAALVALAGFMLLRNEAQAAIPVLEESIDLGRRLGLDEVVALATSRLATVAAVAGDLERARDLAGEAVGLARRVDSPESLATVLSQAARVQLGIRQPEAAIELYRECLGLCQAAGERWLRQRAIAPLAIALSDFGSHAEAQELLREGLTIAGDLGDDRMVVWTVECLAWSRAAEGRAEEAARLLGAAAALRGAEPASAYALDRARTERCRSAAVAVLGDAGFERAHEQGARLAPAEALALALGRPAAPAAEQAPAGGSILSGREREIATLVAAGMSNRAIADRLFISVRTAENHVSHILVKLGLHSRSQLASWVAANE
jgi:predicted ATPase/DNA-binding CsgD family transcriptional regulator